MDDQRFDRLTRAFARGVSRRQAVAIAAGLAVAGARARGAAAQLDQSACAAGQTVCGGACVDLQIDLDNCGACGAVCESGLVAVDCREGQCVRADCPPGVTYCGAVDGCRDLTSDPLHCGACGNACAAGQACRGGVCDAAGACAPGQADCGGTCIDTCCDNYNCGACGNVCPSGTTCFEGVCGCPSGLCGGSGGSSGKPIQLPNTGAGSRQSGPDWTPFALAGAAAAAFAAAWRRAESGG